MLSSDRESRLYAGRFWPPHATCPGVLTVDSVRHRAPKHVSDPAGPVSRRRVTELRKDLEPLVSVANRIEDAQVSGLRAFGSRAHRYVDTDPSNGSATAVAEGLARKERESSEKPCERATTPPR